MTLLRALCHFSMSCQCQDRTDLSYCHCIYCAYKCVCVCFGVPTSPGLTHQPFLPEEDTEERSVSFPPLPGAASRATDSFYFSRCYLNSDWQEAWEGLFMAAHMG